jgi:hypothetical protein
LPSHSKPLPDSFIDAKLKQMACQQIYMERDWPNPPITVNLPQESMFKVKTVPRKVFRSFEPTSDLAEYILELEKKAGIQTKNAEIQTNNPVPKNAEGQTNLTASSNLNIVLGNTSHGSWAEPAGRNFTNTFLTSVEIPKKQNRIPVINIV